MASEQGMTASYASMAPDEPPPAAGGGDGCAWKIDLQRGEGGRRVGRKREAGSMFRSGWGGGWGAAFGAQTPLSPPEAAERMERQRWGKLPDMERVRANPNIDHDKMWRPRCDIFQEDQDHLRVEIELPSIPKEDISLTLKDNVLVIAALKPQTGEEEHGVYFQKERNFGRFYRKIPLPVPVEPKSARTELDAGLLRLHLKISKKTTPRQQDEDT